MMTDPIADLLTKIRNAFLANKEDVLVQYSKIKEAILVILKKEKYVSEFKVVENEGKKNIEIKVNLDLDTLNINRISKPGRRIYTPSSDLKPVMNGYGIGIISTSKGLKTFKEAKKEKIGGEILAHVW